MKAAVIYYSRSGVTKKIAEKVQAKAGKKTPALKTETADFSAYDTVFVGFPVWAATMPDFFREYLSKADLAGKRIIPFVTAGNNGRESSLQALKELLPGSEITNYFYTSMKEKADEDAWLEGIE